MVGRQSHINNEPSVTDIKYDMLVRKVKNTRKN